MTTTNYECDVCETSFTISSNVIFHRCNCPVCGREIYQPVGVNHIIDGVGPDAEVVTNDAGGKQSKSPMAMHLIDPRFLSKLYACYEDDNVIEEIVGYIKTSNDYHLVTAITALEEYFIHSHNGPHHYQILERIAKVMQEGAKKYEPNNWRLIPQEEHINHALIHYLAYKMGDTQDNHLEHCMCRLMMAYATKCSPGFSYTEYITKEK